MPIVNSLLNISPEVIAARILIAAFILPIHEAAHGWMANKMGDPTAKWMGRLTLNPLKHLDPIGSILLIFTGYGWAKPVPINTRNFKNQKQGMAITAAAGPLSNLLIALVFIILWKIVVYASYASDIAFLEVLSTLLFYIVSINVGLAVFNLLPIPPLDGSRVVGLFLPEKLYFQIMQYERYIMIAFFALIMFTNVLDTPLSWLTEKAFYLLDFLTGFIDVIGNLLIR